jgi:zinc protease
MKSRRFLAPLVAAFHLFGCAAAELPDKPIAKDFALQQKDFQLNSGLRVVVQEDHSAPVVAIVSTYNVGSVEDPKGKEGLAHFVEHLAFRTKFLDGVPIMDRLKHMGAEFNATTWWDFTNYFSTVSKDYLEELMQQEAWRIAHIIEGVTPENFAIEKEVVRNELRLGNESSVGGRSFDLLGSALFPESHPMHRGTIGTHASLDSITLDDARAWVKKYYRPENCTIVIAGDVDPQTVGKLLGTWPEDLLFGPGGQKGPKVARPPLIADRPSPPVPEPVNTKLMREKGPVDSPILMLAWSAPAGLRRNDALLNFVANRLNLAFQEGINVKEDDELEGVGAFAEALIHGSMFVVQATLRPGTDPERVRTRILDAVNKAWTTEIGYAQTEFSRWYLSTGMLLSTNDLTGNAVALGQHVAATGSPRLYKDQFDELAKIKPGQITDLAYKYLKRERAVSLYIEPETDQVAKIVGGGAAGTGPSTGGHELGRDPPKMAKDLGPTHILKIARSPGLANLPRWKLPNGLEVVAARQGTAPVATVMVGVRGGDAFTKPYGLAGYAAGFAKSQCDNYGGLDAVGGQVSGRTGSTSSIFTVSVLSGNLPNGVAVLSDNLGCREVSEEAFLNHGKVLDQWTKAYQRISKMPDFVAGKRLWAELYPDHPYGVMTVDPNNLKSVTYEDAAAFVRSHYRPGNSLAVIVGDVDAQQAKTLSEKYLSKWSGGAGSTGILPAPPSPPTARKAFLVDRPKATQATVRIGCRLADGAPELAPIFELAGAMANQRAWSVREEWGASYGVYAGVTNLPGGATHMMIGGAITNKYVGQSVQRLLGILAELESPKIDEKYFLTQRWEVARQFQQRFTSGDRIAGAILFAATQGWPADVWDKYPERLAAASRHDVRAVMKNCVGREIISISGDAAAIAPQMKAIGIKLEAN